MLISERLAIKKDCILNNEPLLSVGFMVSPLSLAAVLSRSQQLRDNSFVLSVHGFTVRLSFSQLAVVSLNQRRSVTSFVQPLICLTAASYQAFFYIICLMPIEEV